MIICNKCNHQNGDNETFCASCGAFLAWDGTRVAEPTPPPPEPEPVPDADPSRPGLIQRVKAVVLDQGTAELEAQGLSGPPEREAAQGPSGPPEREAAPGPSGPPERTPHGPSGPPERETQGPSAVGPAVGSQASSGSPAAPPGPTSMPPPPAGPPPGIWSPNGTGDQAAAPAAAPPPAPPTASPSPPPVTVAPPTPSPEPAAPVAPPAAADRQAAVPPVLAGPHASRGSASGAADVATVGAEPAPGAAEPAASAVPPPVPTPTPSQSFDVAPDADAVARARQEADNNRRYAAERARQEAEEQEREAFKKRQEAAAALFEQPLTPPPTPTPPPGQSAGPVDSSRWGPVPTPTPAPVSQLPGAAEAKRFAPRQAGQSAPPKPGDLVCGSCGAGNDQIRKFCRQCGASLVAAVVEPTLPWWKRLFNRNKERVPPPRPTGPGRPSKRTNRKRTTRRILGYARMGAGLIALAAVLGIAFVEPVRNRVTSFASCKRQQAQAVIKPQVKKLETTASRATRELPDRQASKAFDTNPATFWQVPPPTPADGLTTLGVDFDGTPTVRQIHFFPGLPKANNPASQPTPKTVVMTFRNSRGETVGKQERFSLETNVAKDDQLLKVKPKKQVQSVEVAILDTFDSQAGGTQVAISDIQFFGSPAQLPGATCKVG